MAACQLGRPPGAGNGTQRAQQQRQQVGGPRLRHPREAPRAAVGARRPAADPPRIPDSKKKMSPGTIFEGLKKSQKNLKKISEKNF